MRSRFVAKLDKLRASELKWAEGGPLTVDVASRPPSNLLPAAGPKGGERAAAAAAAAAAAYSPPKFSRSSAADRGT
jgi:hypothetical protein